MANNIFANQPIAVIATQTVSFASIGLNTSNILVIHRIGNPPASWLPTRGINPIEGFVKDVGYVIYPKADMDITAYVVPPIPSELEEIQNWVQANFSLNTHVHSSGEIIGLQEDLATKADLVHSHIVSDVTGLQAALDSKQDALDVQNGLTLTGAVLKLGGTVTEDTLLALGSHNFSLSADTNGNGSLTSNITFSGVLNSIQHKSLYSVQHNFMQADYSTLLDIFCTDSASYGVQQAKFEALIQPDTPSVNRLTMSYTHDATTYAVNLLPSKIRLSANNGSQDKGLDINSLGKLTVHDLAGTGTRMVVADDMGLLSTQAVNPAYSFTNGLAINGSTVGMGGTLTEHTYITNPGYFWRVDGGANSRQQFITTVTSGSTTTTASLDIGDLGGAFARLMTDYSPGTTLNSAASQFNTNANNTQLTYSKNKVSGQTFFYRAVASQSDIRLAAEIKNQVDSSIIKSTEFIVTETSVTFQQTNNTTLTFSLKALPSATTASALYYDPTSGQVTYGAAGTGSSVSAPAGEIIYGNGTGVTSTSKILIDTSGNTNVTVSADNVNPYAFFLFKNASTNTNKANITADVLNGVMYLDYTSTGSSGLIVRSGVGGGNTEVLNINGIDGKIKINSLRTTVTGPATNGNVKVVVSDQDGLLSNFNVVDLETISTISYSSTVTVDFSNPYQNDDLTLAGNVSFAAINLSPAKSKAVLITADSSSRTLTFPSGWVFIGIDRPVSIAANKRAVLSLFSKGTTDSDVWATYTVEN